MEEQAVNVPLFKLKLLDALKSNDVAKVDQLYAQYDSIENAALELLKSTVLHLAVQVSSLKTFESLLQKFGAKYVNSQDLEGNTPLHVACQAQRAECVELLLQHDQINDTLLNKNGLQAFETIQNNAALFNYVHQQRLKYVEKVSNELRKAFTKRDFATLNRIYENPRNVETLDINGLDPDTGDSVLHEFVKKRDVEMVKWILTHGGDPFKRDKNGKLANELLVKVKPVTPVIEELRRILKQASQEQSVIDPVSNTQAPTFRGYLRKWTNFAGGYKLRWFVLDSNGMLSYYKSQNDTESNCRGSINLKNCRLHLDSSEKLKFEILGVDDPNIKWHLKGNHSVETNRWVWSISSAIKFAKDRAKNERGPGFVAQPSVGGGSGISGSNSVVAGAASSIVSGGGASGVGAAAGAASILSGASAPLQMDMASDLEDVDGSDYDSDDSEDSASIYDTQELKAMKFLGAYGKDMTHLKDSVLVELQTLKELLESDDAGDKVSEKSVAAKSLITAMHDLNQLLFLTQKNTLKLSRRLENESHINGMWESSIKELEEENIRNVAKLETYEKERKNLRKILREKLALEKENVDERVLDEMVAKAEHETESKPAAEIEQSLEKSEQHGKDLKDLKSPTLVENDTLREFVEQSSDSEDEFFDLDDVEDTQDVEDVEEAEVPAGSENVETAILPASSTTAIGESNVLGNTENDNIDVSDTNKDESLTLPAPLPLNEVQKSKHEVLIKEKTYNGYEDPVRTKLSRDVDDRPKISLWGILKSMVGKDMTKISLPVSFNECTSLLQRVAEGMEYCELVTKAASIDDSALRMCHVAAFAASEYASTINRVAKPFNPLLGETFEYARPDKNYRFFVEQVSHHPPVSAAIAQSPKWDYYGESAVKSKFNGRSFDVKPLGKWFLHLRPDNGVKHYKTGELQEEELYTWNRVTSSVVGIIVGNPVVDNYGDMCLENHVTGDKLVLNFKARGWTAASAYELRGTVLDKDDKPRYYVKGHWNSKIYCKKADEEESEPQLLWQVNPRPPRPFNLTLFSISLNAITPNLKNWLAPTDTRLRPDQRAMEDGRYDEAAELKEHVEEKQRAARKLREERGEEYRPKFFKKSVHQATGDAYWEYLGSYWKMRSEKKLADTGDIF